MPFPTVEQSDSRYDVTHTLDFCSQLQHLEILGSSAPLLSSSIIPNTLKFELSSFKSLQELQVQGAVLENIYSLGTLRSTVCNICVYRTKINSISQVLQCDMLHKSVMDGNQVVDSEHRAALNLLKRDYQMICFRCGNL